MNASRKAKFIGLLRKLRKEINRYSLQHNEPLQYLHNGLLFCSQLTANIESDLQHGAIAPEVTSSTDGLTLLANFLRKPQKKWIFWILRLRKIYVRSIESSGDVDGETYNEVNIDVEDEALRDVFQFCRQYPKITVFMIVSGFGIQMGVEEFLYTACCLYISSRKDIPAELKFMAECSVRRKHSLDLKFGLGDKIPANWVFYPDGELDELILRDQIKEKSTDSTAAPALAPHEDELLKLVKSWFKNGLR